MSQLDVADVVAQLVDRSLLQRSTASNDDVGIMTSAGHFGGQELSRVAGDLDRQAG